MDERAGIVLGGGYYLHWGVVQVSLTNFLIILGMIVLFIVALLAPFPGGRERDETADQRVEKGQHSDD